MKPMNDLLADIVVASGGTVTSNTRNGLLDGWLEAVSNPVAALSFVSQPQAKTVDEYSLATFSCEVSGGVAPYTYQYKKNNTNVGTNSANLSFTAAAADKNASITVVVTDSAGAVITSTPVAISVMRNVVTFNGVSQNASTPTLNLPADFSLEVDFSTTNKVNQILIGDSHITNLYVNISEAVGLSFYFKGDLFRVAVPVQAFDGNRHAVRYDFIGNKLTAKFDGVQLVGEKILVAGISNINLLIGSSNSNPSSRFSGKIYHVKIESQGAMVRDYRMNDGFANNPVCVNSGTTGSSANGTYIGLTSGSWSREVA